MSWVLSLRIMASFTLQHKLLPIYLPALPAGRRLGWLRQFAWSNGVLLRPRRPVQCFVAADLIDFMADKI
jgi:hypothetical protein